MSHPDILQMEDAGRICLAEKQPMRDRAPCAHMLNHRSKAGTMEPPWDPLETIRASAATSDAAKRFGIPGRYARIAVLLLIAVFVVPQILIALLVMALGGGLPALGHIALLLVMLTGFYLIGTKGFRSFRKASTGHFRAPAIRAPVMAAGDALGLDPRGPIASRRLRLLRTALGDVYRALGLPDEAPVDPAGEVPEEFRGTLPNDGAFWCLMKSSRTALAAVPESFRGGAPATPQARATMLVLVLAFPLRRRRRFRLEILHRIIQVMFARIACTIDTGSTAFNNRFLVATLGTADEVELHRALTPALQSTLLDLSERFWLVNLIVENETAFVSAVDFQTDEEAQIPIALWIEAALGDAIAGMARIKTYLD